ncbi:polymeric immunoglobulin receptor-like isoform X2 [Oreochromis aureus]|uniref:Immunoglobulin domain-containing protein n=1 Tax=Oreochromis aureus TaxID=47969 RepID=A0AAZ1Y2W5_OREAU|nr:polymeric immunoglobulin receptor-like isoform X2 [Oreochromis aureus]
MRRLQNLLFTFCIALRCVTSAVGVIHMTGYVGSAVKVSCSYDEGYESYEKYLCKNDCGSDDVLITTSKSWKMKYMIHDDKKDRIFTTTISDLHSEDDGKYWCGVTRTGSDIYTEVKLKVVKDHCCDTVTKILSYQGYSVSISCPSEPQYQNSLKYICRGNRPSTCLQQALITSYNKENGRFRLDDDKMLKKFTVNITSLRQDDSGSYLCGVQRNFDLDVFSAVELKVEEFCCVKSTKINGTVGHPLTLQCPYPSQHRDNRKFLCKGDQHNSCTEMLMNQSRFTLQNASSDTFVVMISKLEVADAGTYWCGSDSQWRVGNYTKIQLSVFPQSTLGKKNPALYVIPPVLLLICILVLVYKYRRSRIEEAVLSLRRNASRKKEVIDAAQSKCPLGGALFPHNTALVTITVSIISPIKN